ncbi:MAG: DUF86 domain-containing protein [Anaerolineales bacterium]
MKDQQRLKDMLAAVEAIEGYAVADYESLVSDGKTQDAIMYNLIIMGEAANQVSLAFQESHASIPWSSVIGTRNVIVHGYDQVRLQIVWEIIQRDLQKLKQELQKAIKEF